VVVAWGRLGLVRDDDPDAAFWGFVTWAVVAVARGNRSETSSDPEALLARRFAAGDEGE
jgi:hypothetical protein